MRLAVKGLDNLGDWNYSAHNEPDQKGGMDTMNETRKVADYVATLTYEKLPPEVALECKMVILDTLGVLLRASKSKGSSELITNFVSRFGCRGKCTVIGTNLKVDPVNAALANGTLGHDVIELDEVHSLGGGHTAASIVPAALAVAENENAGGKALITGVVAAYDIGCRIGSAFGRGLPSRGFHTTAVAGCFCTTVAAAKLLSLNREGVSHALGLAGSQASGLLAYHDEVMHMNKSFQTGVAARNGVTAALLAQMGFLASTQILDEGRINIFDAFGEDNRFADLIADLGQRFEVMRTGYKGSSVCRVIHAPLDAFLKILDEHQLHPDDIEQVIVKLTTVEVPAVDGHPLTTHNAQEVLATAAYDRSRVTVIAPYSEQRREDPQMLALSKRIRLVGDPELDKLESVHPMSAIVEVETKDGNRFSEQVNDPKGDPANPFTKEEIEEKYMNLAVQVVGSGKAKKIVDIVDKLEELDDVERLASLLKP